MDGFRFDLMNLHTVSNMLSLKQTLPAIEPTLYLYGEGWDFGSANDKDLKYARMGAMAGTGIGVFNDRLRDAAHGGYSTDSLQIRRQVFINDLSYQWNGYCYNNRMQSNLHQAMANLRSRLRGSGDAFIADPQEDVNYVEKYDNETLFESERLQAAQRCRRPRRIRPPTRTANGLASAAARPPPAWWAFAPRRTARRSPAG